MSYIGNTPSQQSFTPAIDYFSGNNSTTAFTLSRPVASAAQVQVTISNVAQNPSTAFSVSGNTITFTSAPPTGTNNIYVYYTSPITQVIAPSQGTVGTTQLASSTGTGSVVLSTSPTVTSPVIAGTPTGVGVLTSYGVQASTSGTSIEFTNIPSWVERITVMFDSVSTNGTTNFQIQAGFGSYEITGYSSSSIYVNTSAAPTGIATTGFVMNYATAGSAAATLTGQYVLTNITGNTWVGSHVIIGSNGAAIYGGGVKAFSGIIDRLRIIASATGNPSSTFDAGSINILYE